MEREKKEQKETELSCLRSGIGIKIKSVKAEFQQENKKKIIFMLLFSSSWTIN